MAKSNFSWLKILTIFIMLFIFNTEAARSPSKKQKFESMLSMEVLRPTSLSYLNSDISDILPIFVGDISYVNNTITWSAFCFRQNEARLEFHKHPASKYGGWHTSCQVTGNASSPLDLSCADLYIFSTPFGIKPDYFFRHGEHKIEFEEWEGEAEYEYEQMRVNFETRPHPWVTPNSNADDIESGDFLALSKIRGQSGGFETLEKWVTGAYAGHPAVCLTNPDGKLFVAKSGPHK
ncbi:uncharacterized protein LOC125371166 [Ricinus communis]|uniref:uncharacterized protein LOC125371166 n=1 Tax=Ricinus communis TaxID=3988 RepID=UPI00077219E2|nr:uncharacterized protein LOC125371166 [Ricinus communis]